MQNRRLGEARDQQKHQPSKGGKRDPGQASVNASSSQSLVIHSHSPVSVTPDGRVKVQRMAGLLACGSLRRVAFPVAQWLMTDAHRLQSRGRLRLWAPTWVSLTSFPYVPPCLARSWGTMQGPFGRITAPGSRRIATRQGRLAARAVGPFRRALEQDRAAWAPRRQRNVPRRSPQACSVTGRCARRVPDIRSNRRKLQPWGYSGFAPK